MAAVTHRMHIQTQSEELIGSQNQMPIAVVKTAPTVPVQKKEVAALSLRAANRVSRLYSANIRAASSGISASGENTLTPGCRMMTTPTKPIPIAAQRRQPTASPKTGPERAATKSG